MFNKFKDRQPKHLKSYLVDKITCSCGRSYIGETGRCVQVRFDEHITPPKKVDFTCRRQVKN